MNNWLEEEVMTTIGDDSAAGEVLVVAHGPDWTRALQDAMKSVSPATPKVERRLPEPRTYDMD